LCHHEGMVVPEVEIRRVDVEHAGELLTLRRAAFVTEAQVTGDPNIPPLTQTLDELVADLQREDVITLGAWNGHRLVGSVRVLVEGSKATLGRFAVAPDVQGLGLGTQLMFAVAGALAEGTEETGVFTSQGAVQYTVLCNKHGITLETH